MWTSQKRYTYGGVVGDIRKVGANGRYRIVDRLGVEHDVDQQLAEAIRKAEEYVAEKGRPTYFPNEPRSSHTITLPDRLWKKLNQPYSVAIARLVQ